jgi:YHS domain-containing protein
MPDRSNQMDASDHPGHIEDVMVKDPVCQVYFPKREGIRWRHGAKTIYFCSLECLEKFKQTEFE